MSEDRLFHSGAWLAWLGGVLAVTMATRNPWYLGLLLLWVGLVTLVANRRVAARERGGGASFPPTIPVWRFALVVIPVAAIFNGLFVHAGETMLFTIPQSIPVIGGDVTLEALVYGALNGVILVALFAAFLLFNRVTPVRDLIRLAPRAYYPVAVTVAVAITFVPVTLRQAAQIREAQAIRGSTLRGVRGWLPLFLPLLSGGLERALMLAEAMVARGFAAGGGTTGLLPQAGMIVGIVLVLVGWLLRLLWGAPTLGAALLLVGIALVALAIWRAGRATPRTTYRPAPWGAREWSVALAALATALLFLLPLPVDRSSLFYTPYPLFTLPPWSPLFGFATWGLLAPAFVLLLDKEPDAQIATLNHD